MNRSGGMYLGFCRMAIFAILISLPFFYLNCSSKNSLYGSANAPSDLFGSSQDFENELPLPPTPPAPLPPADPAPLQNGFAGSGSAIKIITSPLVLFQNADITNLINRDGGVTKQNGVRSPYGLGAYVDSLDQNKLKFLIVDRVNHRILIFNSVPTNANAQPDVVVGQPDFTGGAPNAGQMATNSMGFNEPVHVSVCANGRMLVSDRNNNRVMMYNKVPTANGAVADIVIGQPNFSSSLTGGGTQGLNQPYAAYCIESFLYVLDRNNNRILRYDPPAANMPAANLVIGQPDFNTLTPGCAANKFNGPYEFTRYKNELYVADGLNFRVVKFDTIPNAMGASASVVIGQPNFTSCLANQGLAAPTPFSLTTVNGIAHNDKYLAVSDFNNNRIMFYDLPVTATNPAARAQYGQPNFTTAGFPATAGPGTISGLKSLLFDGNFIWSVSNLHHRLQVTALPAGL